MIGIQSSFCSFSLRQDPCQTSNFNLAIMFQSKTKFYNQQYGTNTMTKIYMIALISTLLTLTATQTAQALTKLKGIEIGTKALTNLDQSQSQVYIHNFQNQFESTPQLALAIVGLEQSNLTLDTSFRIAPESITRTGMTISWSRNIQKWIKITIKYIASVRTDLILGYNQQSIASENGTTLVTINTENIVNFNSSILRTFLLGCDSTTTSFQCGLLPKSVENSSIIVEIYGSLNANFSISFSYIVFSPSNAGFTSYGGYLTNRTFKGTLSSDIHRSIAYTNYRFHGLSYLNFSTVSSAANFSSIIDDDLVIKIDSQSLLDRFALFHLIFGNTAKNSCTNPALPYQQKNLCLASCPQNTYAFSYKDGGKACRVCSQIMNLALVEDACISVNFTKNKTNLTNLVNLFQQKENRQIINTQTTTSTTAIQTNISSSAGLNSSTNVAQSTTDTLNSGPNIKQNQIIQQTDKKQQISQIIQPSQISSSSQSNEPAYEKVLQTSASGSTSNTQNSPPNTNLNSNGISSSQNQAFTNTGKSYYTVSSSCGTNEFLINGVCVCQVGFTRINGYCMTNTFINEEPLPIVSQRATIINPNIFYTNPQVIPSFLLNPAPIDCGQGYDNGFGVCVCSSGLQFSQGRCIFVSRTPSPQPSFTQTVQQCGANMVFYQTSQRCECIKNFVFDINGVCQSCGKNSFEKNGKCQCLSNFVFKYGQCVSSNFTDNSTDILTSNTSINVANNQQNNTTVNANSTNNTSNSSNQTKNITTSDNTTNSTNLQLSGLIRANNNQVFLTVDTLNPFNFPDQQSMKSFMKVKFTGCPNPTVFCAQQANKKNLFDCLFLFPSGIPNKSFTTNFSYNYQSKIGNCSLPIDPLKAQIDQSTLRSSSRAPSTTRVI